MSINEQQNRTAADPLKDALLRFYQAVMAEWAAPGHPQRAREAIKASNAVRRLLYNPGERIGGTRGL